MQKSLTGFVVAAVAIIAVGAGWIFTPSLRAPQQAADAEASAQLERARRLLAQFDALLAQKARSGQLGADTGAEVSADDFSDGLAEDYEAIHERFWTAYPPVDWRGDRPTPAKANYGNIAGQVSEGLNHYRQLAQANLRLLDDALRATDAALNITVGGASARNHAEANRLKGIVLYYQAMVSAAEAAVYRDEAEHYLQALATAAIRGAEAEAARAVVEQSTIDERIAGLDERAEALRVSIEADRNELQSVDGRIAEMESKLAHAVEQRDRAFTTLENLRDRGAVFGDPQSGEQFARDVAEASARYRAADREAQALEHGTLENARIAPGHDELLGEYVGAQPGTSPSPVRGLIHVRNDRIILAERIAGKQNELDGLREDLSRLDGIKASVLARGRTIEQSIDDATKAGAEAYSELDRLQTEAYSREDQALQRLDQAARIAEQAAGFADAWVRDAQSKTQSLSPEAKERSAFHARVRDGWMSGAMLAQAADAHLTRASIQYARHDAHARTADALERLLQFASIEELDPQEEQDKADQARAAGVEEIKLAMNLLQKAHNKSERHWTLTAQAAAANDLLFMFGYDDYAKDAMEAYRAAVKGRESEPFAAPFVARASRLEGS